MSTTSECLQPLPSLQEFPLSRISPALDGREGGNRDYTRSCQVKALNDWEAIQAWLHEYQEVPATHRTYQKEAERLLLWCIYQHQKPLSGLNRSDLEEYRLFIQNPMPRERWCAPQGVARGTLAWRPFVKGLSPRAEAFAFSVLNSLFSYLVQAHYLRNNPLQLVRRKRKREDFNEKHTQERILEDDEWAAILTVLEELPEEDALEAFKKKRLKMIVYLLYFLGLRVSELVSLNWNSFKKLRQGWWLFVIGKGGKPGKVPVNDELFIALAEYRLFLDLPLEPSPEEGDAVITDLKGIKRLSDRSINLLLKEVGNAATKRFVDQPVKVKRLKTFSAHWLRHLSGTMQDRAGIKDTHIQANHRHGKIDTTRQYIHAMDDSRYTEMLKLKLIPKKA